MVDGVAEYPWRTYPIMSSNLPFLSCWADPSSRHEQPLDMRAFVGECRSHHVGNSSLHSPGVSQPICSAVNLGDTQTMTPLEGL